ncbi:MAG: DNA polymerase Y family protein [Candidatus Levyibacteriota bacterium]
MNTILHIDFDSFFASCEQHFNPNLRGKPIGVTAENGRTCIIAASREAKKFGVKTGTRTWEATQMCPNIQFVKADFDRYLHITKKFIDIASYYSPIVEVFSMDEVFIDMTPTMHLFKNDIHFLAAHFKDRIKNEIGEAITVSIGVSYNKLLAKLASGLNKPDGFMLIDKGNLEKVYKNTELTDICGIGERLKRRLNKLGIYTLLQVRDYPPRLLKKEFGKVCSQNLMNYAWAQDASEVHSFLEEEENTKSVGRNYCLPQNEYDPRKVLGILSELSEEVGRRLRLIGKKGRTLHFYMGGELNFGGRKTTPSYTNTGKDIFSLIQLLLKEWRWQNLPYEQRMIRQVHLSMGNLIDERYVTPGLFDDPREEVLNRTIDKINDRFGSHAIRHGYTLKAPKLRTKPNGFFGDKAMYSTFLKSGYTG